MRRFLPALLVLASVSQLRAQEVPADALEHLLEAGRDRLSAGNGWALVVAGHGTLPSSNAADTLDIPVESDWNYLIAVCLNCAGRIGAGVGMDIYAPDGRDIGNSY